MSTDNPPTKTCAKVAAAASPARRAEGDDGPAVRDVSAPTPTAPRSSRRAKSCRDIYETGNGTFPAPRPLRMEDGEIIVTELPYQSRVEGARADRGQMRRRSCRCRGPARRVDHEHPTGFVITAALDASTPSRSWRICSRHRPGAHVSREPESDRADGAACHGTRALSRMAVFPVDTVTRRLNYRLEKSTAVDILDGLLIAYLTLDEVIRIVRPRTSRRPR